MIRYIPDARYNPIESYEYRHLDKEWKTGTHGIHVFFLIECHHFLSDPSLISFEILLYFLYLRLNLLQFFLTHEHLFLWDDKYETNNERNNNNRETERMSGYIGKECNKKVIDWFEKNLSEKRSEEPRFSMIDSHYRSVRSRTKLYGIFTRFFLKNF